MENEDKKVNEPSVLEEKPFDRRGFLKTASILSLGTLGIACSDKKEGSTDVAQKKKVEVVQQKEEKAAPVEEHLPGVEKRGEMTYRTLGKTGLKVSDISFGAGKINDPNVVGKAIDLGINYFDTAPDYSSGHSEKVLGKGFKKTSVSRDKIVVATKMCAVGGYPKHYYGQKAETLIKGVEGSLKRLQTDYIDFLFVHALGERHKNKELSRLKDPEMLEAFEKLKKAGKVRYLAVSSHNYAGAIGGGVEYAIDSGNFDLVMTAFNYGKLPHDKYMPYIKKMINKAKKKGVAYVAMKSLKGARGLDRSKLKGQGTFAQAAFKWVLSHPVSTVVVTMNNMNQINQYIKASGKKMSMADEEILYKQALADNDCQIGCYDCEKSCPKDVHVGDILRYNMYFTNYDQEKDAMLSYSKIPAANRADNCTSCSAGCETACPYGVPIQEKLVQAHQNLSLI